MKLTHGYSILIILFIFLISCNNKEDKEIDVINDAFLTVTDTVAYYELSLRPPGADPNRKVSTIKSLQIN